MPDQPMATRPSKLTLNDLAPEPVRIRGLLGMFPRTLAAETLRRVVQAWAAARRNGQPVVLVMGAHPIKVGLSPVIIHLLEHGLIQGIAGNGALLVHDSELARYGHTSEAVEAGLADGTYGQSWESLNALVAGVQSRVRHGMGLGAACGDWLVTTQAPHRHRSVIARAYEREIPVLIHAACGTDVYYLSPEMNGAIWGQGSWWDFQLFVDLIEALTAGGLLLNLGSAVIGPEIILKALAHHGAQGKRFPELVAVNMDMIQGYRGTTQVVERVRALGGTGLALTGHHEIMLPLLAGLVLEALTPGEESWVTCRTEPPLSTTTSGCSATPESGKETSGSSTVPSPAAPPPGSVSSG